MKRLDSARSVSTFPLLLNQDSTFANGQARDAGMTMKASEQLETMKIKTKTTVTQATISALFQKAVETPPKTAQRKLGSNRGKTRLWLEGNILSDSNWNRGDSFDVIWLDGVLRYIKNPNGSRKVAGTEARPIIDTNTDKISTTLHATTGEKVSITVTSNSITIQK